MPAKTKGEFNFTADDILRERVELRKPWEDVALALGCTTPEGKPQTTKVRAAWRKLTGKPPSECKPVGQAKGNGKAKVKRAPANGDSATPAPASSANPHWTPDSDQDEIIARLEPIVKEDAKGKRYNAWEATLVVARQHGFFETMRVGYLKGLHYEQDDRVLAVDFLEGGSSGNYRAIDVTKIVEVY